MKPIQLFPLNPEAIAELDELNQTTRDVRVRTRAQMVLLAGEQGLLAHEIAVIVRKDEQTVRRWLKRHMAEGVNGLQDAPGSGAASKITTAYQEKLIQTVRPGDG